MGIRNIYIYLGLFFWQLCVCLTQVFQRCLKSNSWDFGILWTIEIYTKKEIKTLTNWAKTNNFAKHQGLANFLPTVTCWQ